MPNQPSCKDDTVCTPDKTYESTPTPFADPKCICILGKTFQNQPIYNPALPCTAVTQCKSRVYFSATLSSDNICAFVDVVFNADFNLVNSTNASSSFIDALSTTIVTLTNSNSYTQFVLNPGSIVATVQGANETQIDTVKTLAVNGLLTFTWNGLVFNGTTASKDCDPGFNPNQNGQCVPCPANTYVCLDAWLTDVTLSDGL
jgi:hypothetical protein